MTLKVTKLKPQDKRFPKLMIAASGTIILATEYHTPNYLKGTVVFSTCHSVGYYTEQWEAHAFIDYNGPITLENE